MSSIIETHRNLEIPRTRTAHKNKIVAGIVTGQIAGLVMAVVVMLIFALFLGTSPLYPVQVIGSTLLGEKALEGFNFLAVLAGLVLHQFGPSLLWGFVYGFMATKTEISSKNALFYGLLLGVVSMIGPYLLMPFIMNTLHGVDYWNREVPMIWDWAAHIVFGTCFVLFPKILGKVRKS